MSVSNLNSSGQGKMNAPYQEGMTDMTRMLMQRVTAAGGTKYIPVGTTQGSFYSFIAQEDTVISAMTGINNAGSPINFRTQIGLAGVTLKQGALISVAIDETIQSITVASGSLLAYKAKH